MSKKILVVDDSSTVRQQVGQALEKAGYAIVEAANGKEGMDRLAALPELSMVICDVNMPVMNGIEMLEELQRSGSALPVVMLTTEGQPELIQRAKRAGAKGWIVKPFNPDLLLKAVEKLAAA